MTVTSSIVITIFDAPFHEVVTHYPYHLVLYTKVNPCYTCLLDGEWVYYNTSENFGDLEIFLNLDGSTF